MDNKSCVHCNILNKHDKYVTCICNTSVHYECLNHYGSTPNAWISSNPVIKHDTSILCHHISYLDVKHAFLINFRRNLLLINVILLIKKNQ